MIILGYIFKATITNLVKAANLELLYIPAAFASLWLAQYSSLITYFDDTLNRVYWISSQHELRDLPYLFMLCIMQCLQEAEEK